MKLSYAEQVSPKPIKLATGGSVKKIKINDIWDIGEYVFSSYQSTLLMSPKDYYTKLREDLKEQWENIPDDEKEKISMFDVLKSDNKISILFQSIFDFFFVERVIYIDGLFLIVKNDSEYKLSEYSIILKLPNSWLDMTDEQKRLFASHNGINKYDEMSNERYMKIRETVVGSINESNFSEVVSIIKQVCMIESDKSDEDDISKLKFKNKKAKEIYLKTIKAQKDKEKERYDKNLSIPNIISAVCYKHPSINYLNVGGLTMFQLIDNFNRLNVDNDFYIAQVRVAVWGDSENQFKRDLWYLNNYKE